MSKKKQITISIDKLDNEYLEALRERTGKSVQELFKLALAQLHDKLCEQKTPSYPGGVLTYHVPSVQVLPKENPPTIEISPYVPGQTRIVCNDDDIQIISNDITIAKTN